MHGARSILRALSDHERCPPSKAEKQRSRFGSAAPLLKPENVRQPMRFTAVGGGAQVARSTKTGGISSGCPLLSS